MKNDTQPFILRDYPAWHKGRQYYALWYIDINEPNILNLYQQLQSDLADYLQPDYRRQAHITLFVNGFWVDEILHDDDFTQYQLQQQIHALQQLKLSPFRLSITGLASFLACPYIAISPNQNLDLIRTTLATHHQEIAPNIYTPHITLGFYRNRFAMREIEKELIDLQQKYLNRQTILVDKLCFGIYQAQDLQGKLFNQVELNL
ncbi:MULTISPECIES: 2'-5' RNA ligase family protein [unclassified Acinetobacter]|uniref:2'-5' RNA ligase family protein n=1 Tax=unclassified Acinetobacter TaxID=196816 RepID=UPI0035B8ABE8